LVEYLKVYFINKNQIKRKESHPTNNLPKVKKRRMSLSLLNDSENNNDNNNSNINNNKIEGKQLKVNKYNIVNEENFNKIKEDITDMNKNPILYSDSMTNSSYINDISLDSKEKEEQTDNMKNIEEMLMLKKIKKENSNINNHDNENNNESLGSNEKDQEQPKGNLINDDKIDSLKDLLDWKNIKQEDENERIESEHENEKEPNIELLVKDLIDLKKVKQEEENNNVDIENRKKIEDFNNESSNNNMINWKKIKLEGNMSDMEMENKINENIINKEKGKFSNEFSIKDLIYLKKIKQENEVTEMEMGSDNGNKNRKRKNFDNDILTKNSFNWKKFKIKEELREGRNNYDSELINEFNYHHDKNDKKKICKNIVINSEQKKISNNKKRKGKGKGKEKAEEIDTDHHYFDLNDFENNNMTSPLLSSSTLPSSLSLTMKELNDNVQGILHSSYSSEDDQEKSLPLLPKKEYPTLEDIEASSSTNTSDNIKSNASVTDENSDNSMFLSSMNHDKKDKNLLLTSPSFNFNPLKKEYLSQSPTLSDFSSGDEEDERIKIENNYYKLLNNELYRETFLKNINVNNKTLFFPSSPSQLSSSISSSPVPLSLHSSSPSLSSSSLSSSSAIFNLLPLFDDNKKEKDFKEDNNEDHLPNIKIIQNKDKEDSEPLKMKTLTHISSPTPTDLPDLPIDNNIEFTEDKLKEINNVDSKEIEIASSVNGDLSNSNLEEGIISKNDNIFENIPLSIQDSSSLKEFSDFIDEINNENDIENVDNNNNRNDNENNNIRKSNHQTSNQKTLTTTQKTIPLENNNEKNNQNSNNTHRSNDSVDVNDNQNLSVEDLFLLFIQDYLKQGDRVWELV